MKQWSLLSANFYWVCLAGSSRWTPTHQNSNVQDAAITADISHIAQATSWEMGSMVRNTRSFLGMWSASHLGSVHTLGKIQSQSCSELKPAIELLCTFLIKWNVSPSHSKEDKHLFICDSNTISGSFLVGAGILSSQILTGNSSIYPAVVSRVAKWGILTMTVAMLGVHAFMHKWGGEMREKGRQCKNMYTHSNSTI